MSIAILNQVYEETRRLTVAGSNLAKDDFRLKKLLPPLEKAAKKAPVFGTVAKSIDKLITVPEKESPQALLDLSSLITAIFYTQGQTGAKGKLKEIESTEMEVQTTQTSARMVKPLIEALTTTGSGRLAIVQEAFEQGAFRDLRLVNYAIAALDDKYSEVADFMADKVLPIYGKAILPRIQDRIDIKAKGGGSARRLRLLHSLDPVAARPIVLDAFENGNKDMRIAALGCLGGSKEDLPHLHDQAKAKSKEVRQVAFQQLVGFTDDTTIELFTKALNSRDISIVQYPVSRTKSKKLVATAIAETRKAMENAKAASNKTKADTEVARLIDLLYCFWGREDKEVVKLFSDLFESRERVQKTSKYRKFRYRLVEGMLQTGDKKLHKRIVESAEEFEPACFMLSFKAAAISLKPTEFYDQFSSYYTVGQKKGKGSKAANEVQQAISNMLWNRFGVSGRYWESQEDNSSIRKKYKALKLDPRWLTAAIELDDLDVVAELMDTKNKKLKPYIEKRFASEFKESDSYQIATVLRLAIDSKHPKATEFLVQTLKRTTKKRRYYLYWIAQLVSRLPKKSAKTMADVLPELHESVVDQILPHLQTLQAK